MFEHSLIDLEAKPTTRRRWLSLPIAVGLHVAGLTAFAFASYWNVGAVLDPSVNMGPVTFVDFPPPPPGGGGRQPKSQTQEIKKAAAPQPTKPVQPTAETVPDKPPAPASSDAVRDVTHGFTNGSPAAGDDTGTGSGTGGTGDGIGIGKGQGDGDDPTEGIGETAPIRLSFGMTRPEILYQVQPRYSEQARRAGVQGMVIVEAVIDEQGQVTKVRLIRGLPMALDQAAMQAVQQWRFKPAMLNGHPVKIFYTLTVNFSIQR